jgi:hypothetical protein
MEVQRLSREVVLTPEQARARIRLLNATTPGLDLADTSARDLARVIRALLALAPDERGTQDRSPLGDPATVTLLRSHVKELVAFLRGAATDPYVSRRVAFGRPPRSALADQIERAFLDFETALRGDLDDSANRGHSFRSAS